MKRMRGIGQNTLWGLMEKCILILFPLLTYPYAARVLGPAGIGRYSFAASLTSYFALLAGFGIPLYATRACAAYAGDRGKLTDTASELLTLNVISALAAELLLLCAVYAAPAMAENRALFLLLSTTIALECFGMNWLFQAEEAFSFLACTGTLTSLAAVPFLFLFVRTEKDVLPYAAFSLLGPAMACLVKLLALHRRLRLSVLPAAVSHVLGADRRGFFLRVASHARRVRPFFLMSCAVKLYESMDVILLGFLRGANEVGLYDVGVKMKFGLSLFSGALWTAALPRALRKWEASDREGFFRLGRLSYRTVLAVQYPAALFLCAFASPCVHILAGDAYEGGSLSARILCLSVLPVGLSNVAGGQLLIPMGRERSLLHAELVGATVNFTFNLLVIPRFGASGAAATTLLSELVVMVWAISAYAREGRDGLPPLRSACRVPFGTAAGLAACMFLPAGGPLFKLFTRAAVFFPVYAAVMLLLRDEWFLQALHRLRKEHTV